MFRVVIEHDNDRKPGSRYDLEMKTEKLFELIGRYTLKYGPPQIMEEIHGFSEYEFYKQEDTNYKSATIIFCKIHPGKRERKVDLRSSKPTTTYTPPPPPKPTEPDDTRIVTMLAVGVIEVPNFYR